MNLQKKLILELFKPNIVTALAAVFATLVGFYFSHVVEELRSGYTAIYSFEPDIQNESVVFHFDNISRSKRIEAANFLVRCRDQNPNCFAPLPGSKIPIFVREVITAPNYGRPIDTGHAGPAVIQVCLGAIASSRTSIRFFPTDGADSKLSALYDPWSTDCKATETEANSLLLLKPTDLHAFLAQHFFVILAWVLFVSGIVLMVAALGVVFQICGALKHSSNPMEAKDENNTK